MKKDVSVLITGPLDDRTYESIDSYSDQGFEEIIVSTWDNENIDLLNKTNKKYKLVTYSYPKHLKKANLSDHLCLQEKDGNESQLTDFALD